MKKETYNFIIKIISILSIIIIWALPILFIFTDNYYLFSYVIWYIPATIMTAFLIVNIAKKI